jgi:hypothetical protein
VIRNKDIQGDLTDQFCAIRITCAISVDHLNIISEGMIFVSVHIICLPAASFL